MQKVPLVVCFTRFFFYENQIYERNMRFKSGKIKKNLIDTDRLSLNSKPEKAVCFKKIFH